MKSAKTKKPEWHTLQRLKNLGAYVEERINAGAYDADPGAFEQAKRYLEGINAKIEHLEVLEKAGTYV